MRCTPWFTIYEISLLSDELESLRRDRMDAKTTTKSFSEMFGKRTAQTDIDPEVGTQTVTIRACVGYANPDRMVVYWNAENGGDRDTTFFAQTTEGEADGYTEQNIGHLMDAVGVTDIDDLAKVKNVKVKAFVKYDKNQNGEIKTYPADAQNHAGQHRFKLWNFASLSLREQREEASEGFDFA
jgi:hypothetical protein